MTMPALKLDKKPGVPSEVDPGPDELFQCYDDFLPTERRMELYQYLLGPGWEWGWRSNRQQDTFRFWHKHFAGERKSDKKGKAGEVINAGYDCELDLKANAPLVWCFWEDVKRLLLPGHTLVRCYANGIQYGSDGTVHTDSVVKTSYTSVYYPHGQWDPNWGGETLFYNAVKDEILWTSYPKPGRLVCFPGTVPHRAAAVSRTCPLLRITLMFKTEYDEHQHLKQLQLDNIEKARQLAAQNEDAAKAIVSQEPTEYERAAPTQQPIDDERAVSGE